VSKYITTVGEYTIRLTVTDSTAALASKSWTVQNVDIGLKSNFNDTNVYSGDVSFSYTPYGLLDKEIHFVLDGVEIHTENISRSGVPMSHVIPAQSHGAHLLEVYLTAEINGKKIGVEEIIDENSGEVTGYNYNIKVVKDILWNDGVSTVPMIGCVDTIINAVQYNTVNIKYAVFDPSTETPEVEWYLDGNLVSTEKLSEKGEDGYYTYSYKAYTAGTYIFTIKCGEATPKTITLTVDELDLNIAPVTTGLEFDFNPVGYTNSSENRLWAHGDVTMTVSDNFDWVNGGYQQDENGDWCFCVKAGTNAVINYNLFADDPKKNGKEFKLIFRTRNIRKRDTSFLTCLDYNEQLGTQIGLDMKVENATLYESTGSLRSDYCEDTIIEYEFNIHKNTDMTIVMSYEDGTPSKPYKYTELSSFKQSSVKPITIGSDDCDIHIYRMKAYSNSLTDADILNNFIADARNADEIIARYNRNQIYNENGILIDTATDGGFSVENLMKTAPDLRYIFLEVPQFTNDKDNKIDGCTVYFRYPAGTRDQDNWTCTGMRHRGQGTSSNTYGYAGRNIDLCMDRKTSLFTWTDQEGNIVESSTITLSDTSVPTDYLNIKVNIASSENTNNAEIARRFNEYQPFLRYARKKDSRVKDTMEFYNCVVFIRETSEDASVPHREFSDTNWHFYAIGNIGDSKKTDDTRVNDKDDPKEHVIEIADADKPLSAFPTGKDGHVICPPDEWHAGNSAYDALYADLLFELNEDGELEFSSFGEETYEFRYEKDGITDEEREANIAIWRDLYRFIVTSTDKEFYEHLKDYFVVDSALYYYLFTERYTMVDNRAKNSFWHYGKVYISTSEAAEIGETEASYYIIDDGAAAIHDGYRYDLTFGYDFDTALGIDNTGDYVFSYGKEDTDYYDGDTTKPVFRVHDSVFFCRLRDLFQPEMSAMFRNREEKNAWAASALIAQWDNAQALFPEELWRLDYERKYYRTYLGLSIDGSIVPGGDDQKNEGFLIGKFFGRKKYSRRAFETNQEIYYASKYFGNAVLSSLITIRGNIYSGDNVDLKQNYSLTLVPYSDMYVCVQYTSTGTPIHQKAKAGETVFFENNAETMDFIYIFAAGWIQEIGDLSRCYIDDNNFAAGTRLQKIVIGSADEGYDNPYMKQLSVGSNKLLEYIDLRNISGINTVIDVSGCSNLKKLLAKGTNASGVVFANGGAIQTAELPAITALSARNLFDLTTLDIESCHKLTTLTIENCPKIDIVTIIDQAPNINDVRVTGIDWYLTDTSLLERLYEIYKIDSENAYLAGSVYVPTIKEKQYYDYTQAWDLLITYDKDGWIRQYLVSYVNHDESLLYSLYVDEGGYAYDPVDNGDIDAPTKVSSVSTDYTYSGWNTSFPLQIWGPVTIQAIYAESVRKYTIRYVNPLYVPELVLQETEGDYGTLVPYAGETPTYDLKEGENGWSYSLFEKWDKPGLILGDTTVTADFKTFRYTAGVFDGKELKDLTPVQLYALSKLVEPIDKSFTDYGIDIETGDDYSFTMGYDIDYDDDTIVSEEFVSQKTVFNGSSDYIDTGVKLFDEDKDFVLALDYKMLSGNALSATLMQCYQTSGTQGFQLNYKNTPSFIWGGVSMSEDGTTVSPSAIDAREMLVLRHKKGDNNLYLYTSNLSGDTIKTYVIPRDVVTVSETATLILGAAKAENGSIRNHAKGEINWCKLWFIDLGDDICRKLAEWTHEKITLEVSGFNRYQLHDDTTKESVMSLLATHLLDVKKPYNISNNNNTGGWADCELNRYLNNRFYNAIPYQIKALMKNVSVKSTIGNNQAATKSSGSFVVVPALYDVYDDASDTYREELYEFANTIDYFTGLSNDQEQTNRIRRLADADPESEGTQYWLRSPSIVTWSTNRYCYSIDEKGEPDQITGTSTEHGILIEISI